MKCCECGEDMEKGQLVIFAGNSKPIVYWCKERSLFAVREKMVLPSPWNLTRPANICKKCKTVQFNCKMVEEAQTKAKK